MICILKECLIYLFINYYIIKIMMKFKINGERNSGTNFLRKLLDINFGGAFEQKQENNIVSFWKHGAPDNEIKKLYPKIVDIFIVRDLNKWLVSMFYNPYSLTRVFNFKHFLLKKQECRKENILIDSKTNECVNKDDEDKTIFDIRYYKLQLAFDYMEKNNNVVIINLDCLQNDILCNRFLEKIQEEYGFKPKVKKFITSIPHTKSKQDGIKNREYKIKPEDYKSIIDKHKIDKIEKEIYNMFLMKSKGKITRVVLKE